MECTAVYRNRKICRNNGKGEDNNGLYLGGFPSTLINSGFCSVFDAADAAVISFLYDAHGRHLIKI